MVFLPGTALEGLLCAFDVERTSFAVSGSDGRVKVFDAASGHLQTDFGASGTGGKQLIENYTSICWGARPLVRRRAPSPAFCPCRQWSFCLQPSRDACGRVQFSRSLHCLPGAWALAHVL